MKLKKGDVIIVGTARNSVTVVRKSNGHWICKADGGKVVAVSDAKVLPHKHFPNAYWVPV